MINENVQKIQNTPTDFIDLLTFEKQSETERLCKSQINTPAPGSSAARSPFDTSNNSPDKRKYSKQRVNRLKSRSSITRSASNNKQRSTSSNRRTRSNYSKPWMLPGYMPIE